MSKTRAHRPSVCLGALVAASGLLMGCASTPLEDGQRETELKQSEAKRNVGLDHLKNGRLAMAIRELHYSRELNADDPIALIALGEAYRRKGKLEESEGFQLRALELDPGYHEGRLNLSALYIQMQRYEDAIEHAQQLYDDPLFASPWRALTNRGFAEMKLGRRRDARLTLEKALEYRFDYWPAVLNLGILEAEAGHPLKAVEHFSRILDSGSGQSATGEVNYRLGEIFVTLGRRDQAVRHFAAAVEHSPNGLWGRQSAGYLKLLQ